MRQAIIAFDRESARSFDADGRLHVAKSHISKANVCPYLGSEIQGWQNLGLSQEKIYLLYRDPAELEKAAPTFNNLPLLNGHIEVSAKNPQKEKIVGSIGSDVAFNSPYLDASLCVWDAAAIAGIEANQIAELSASYRYDIDMTTGVSPEGERYDGRMINIRGNHLALVEKGRVGPDVLVADSDPFHQPKVTTMKKTRLGHAIQVALSAVSPNIAADSALPDLVSALTKKKAQAKDWRKAVYAMDAEISAETVDKIIDAILGVEDEPVANPAPAAISPEGLQEDEDHPVLAYLREKLTPEDLAEVSALLSNSDGKKAEDEEGMSQEEVEAQVNRAMDSARKELRKELSKQFKELEIAKSVVRPVCGDVIGFDSAEQVWRFALKELGVDAASHPASGLETLFKVARDAKLNKAAAPMAFDSGLESLEKDHPTIAASMARFG